MSNYAKYLQGEALLQKQVIDWLRWTYPDVLVHHSPNEGKRSKFEQYLIKAMGVKAGFPDLFFAEPRQGKAGLFIELKAIYQNNRKNHPTKNQKYWLEELARRGYECHVCWTFEEVEKIVNNYFKKEK